MGWMATEMMGKAARAMETQVVDVLEVVLLWLGMQLAPLAGSQCSGFELL
jgi:hypothetical protein